MSAQVNIGKPSLQEELKDGWTAGRACHFDRDQVRASATKKVLAYFADGRWFVEVQTKGVQPFREQDRRLIDRSVWIAYRGLMRFYSILTRSREKERVEKKNAAPLASPTSKVV